MSNPHSTQRTLRLGATLILAGALAFSLACSDNDARTDQATASPEAAHDDESPLAIDAATVQHHYQALLDIRGGDIEDATHHVEHIIDGVDGPHLTAMNEILDQLEARDLHEAEHGIEGMLAGVAELGLSSELLHLSMALDGLDADIEDASHHLEHFIASAPHEDAEQAEAILSTVAGGQRSAAAEQLSTLIARLSGEHADDDHHDDDDHSAATDARTVNVVMHDFSYGPNEIHVKIGETVHLVIENDGSVLHDITTDEFHGDVDAPERAAHAHEGGAEAPPSKFHAAVESGGESELTFIAETPGTFELYCTVPGHRQLGMTATLIVEAD